MIAAAWGLNLDVSRWEDWVPAAVGVLIALAVVSVGLFLFGWRRQSRQAGAEPSLREGAPEEVFAHRSVSERRTSPRRGGNPVSVLVADAGARTPPYPALVLDRSAGGLGLLTEREFSAGANLRVRVAQGDAHAFWVEVVVRSCVRHGSGWRVGCQFIKPPPAATMLLFG